jgi:hypothetical protein
VFVVEQLEVGDVLCVLSVSRRESRFLGYDLVRPTGNEHTPRDEEDDMRHLLESVSQGRC